MRDIALRPVGAADVEYLVSLHADAFRPYVEQIWGWDDDEQRAYLARTLDPQTARIVVVDGVDAGRLDVEDRGDEVFLVLLELNADHRGLGIGSQLIRDVLAKAAAEGKRVTLSVLQVNHRAHRLYRRLGFVETSCDGVAPEIRIRMLADPPPPQTSQPQ